jgi:hypothetical protein
MHCETLDDSSLVLFFVLLFVLIYLFYSHNMKWLMILFTRFRALSLSELKLRYVENDIKL